MTAMSRFLNNPSVHMKSPELVEKKLERMVLDGLDKLMVRLISLLFK